MHTEQDLEKTLQKKEPCFILFYAEWCPFSIRFLPIFEHCSKEATYRCYRIRIDEYPHLCEKYFINVYPTVLFFQHGIVTKRLDGFHGIGLNQNQFREFIGLCSGLKH
jgi:thioredoxin-like negative regulator of GroEL